MQKAKARALAGLGETLFLRFSYTGVSPNGAHLEEITQRTLMTIVISKI